MAYILAVDFAALWDKVTDTLAKYWWIVAIVAVVLLLLLLIVNGTKSRRIRKLKKELKSTRTQLEVERAARGDLYSPVTGEDAVFGDFEPEVVKAEDSAPPAALPPAQAHTVPAESIEPVKTEPAQATSRPVPPRPAPKPAPQPAKEQPAPAKEQPAPQPKAEPTEEETERAARRIAYYNRPTEILPTNASVKFIVKYDRKKDSWVIRKEGVDRVVRRVDTKEEAMAIARALCRKYDANLVVHKKDGKFQKH